MKYLIRSIKYLIYFAVVFFILVAIICIVMKHPISQFTNLFAAGSIWRILLLFVGVSALYPLLGYRKQHIALDGPFSDYRPIIIKTMEDAEYKLDSEDDKQMVFRHTKCYIRASRMWEDSITFYKDEESVLVDGPFRDSTRLIGAIYYNYRMNNPKENE